MKRNRRKSGKNARNQAKQSRSLSYDPLEPRQLLAVDTGLDLIGASLVDPDVNSVLPNAEGDVSLDHFVEIGEQTFTVYDRNNAIVEATTLNQFFVDAGGELFGEDLNAPRIIFDQLSQRWFAVATGDDSAPIEGNWLHIAFSDTADPTGQWQQVQFVPDITGTSLHTNATLGVDADGVYVATQNFDQATGDIEDVSIYSIPKADLFLANPTIADLTRFDSLDILTYGQSIQFASNFDASDGAIHAFSTPMIDSPLGAGFEEAPASINTFQITDADTPDANLTTPTQIMLGNFEAPLPIEQPINTGNGQPTVNLTPGVGLTSSLREVNGSIFVAQTVHIVFTEGGADFRTNAINWFQLNVEPGQAPVLATTELRGDVNHVIVDTDEIQDNLGNNLPDEPEFDLDPMLETNEFGRVTYFNPSIAVNETGLVALTFNGTTQRDAVEFGAVDQANFGVSDPQDNNDAFRISTFASVGLTVNGARTGGTDANPIFGRNAIQLEEPVLIRQSAAVDPFTTSGPFNVWGQYSSLSADPANPNAFFSVIPFQDEASNEEWGVHVAEILPVFLRPVIEATAEANEIIVSLDPTDSGIVQIEIDGVITDRFDRSIIGQIVIAGHDGSDTIIIDHSNGDPTPTGIPAGFNGTLQDTRGFVLQGGNGTDVVEIRSDENVDFVVDALTNDGLFYPGYLAGALFASDPAGLGDSGAQDGTFTLVTQNGAELLPENRITNTWVDVETIVGGTGDDTFDFQTGPLAGNAEGRGGDDVFIFSAAITDGSVNGGTGFNTLDLSQRASDTEIELFSIGQNMGFNGRTVDGPIGQFDAVLDQFRDISLIIGSDNNPDDSLQALNQHQATYTVVSTTLENIRIPNNSDPFIASSLEQNGATLFFTNFEELSGSVLDDVFNVQSTDLDGNEDLLLDGRAGNDAFNFSSNAPLNTGTTADIGGLIFIEGGGGESLLTVSDEGRTTGAEYLVLGARISGPVEIVYQDAFDGNFDVTIIGSNAGNDTFTLQSFLPTNTLTIFGRAGNDVFIIQDLSQAEVELFGGEGDDEYIIEQVNGIDNRNVLISDSIDAETDRVIIAGTVLDEIFIVDIDSFESDQFIFIGIEEFGFDGRGGDDEFYVRGIAADFPVVLRGGDGNDIFHISSDAPANLGDLTTLNNNLIIDGGAGINQIIISNESGAALDVEITTNEIIGLFNGTLTYSSSNGGVFGLVDEDGNLDDENFGGIDITGSNSGNDRFAINGFLAQHSLVIDGRLGDDEFIIGDGMGATIDGVVVVDGASGSDTYTIRLDDISANVMLLDSGFSGTDTLNALGSNADETVRLTEFNISTDTQTIQINNFIEEIIIDAMGGNDTLILLNAPAPVVTLNGNDGNDTIRINGTIGVTDLTIEGGAGNDTTNINEASFLTDVDAFGSSGDDTFTVSDSVDANVELDGGLGNDSYSATFVGGGSRVVQIIDGNPADENNTATISGTSSGNEFFVSNTNVIVGAESILFGTSIDALAINGFGGDDIFNVPTITIGLELNGNTGDDVFNLASDAPALTGNVDSILNDVNISGGLGINQLNIVDETGAANNVTITSNTITGLTNGVITYAGRFDRTDGTIGGIHIIGSNTGNDTFDIVSFSGQNSLRIDGLGGDDTFNIGNGVAGSSLFDGGEGADTYNFEFGAAVARNITIEDTGMTGVDTLNLIGSANDDNIIVSNAGISDGLSTLSFNVPLNVIEIMGLGGNDSFVIDGSQVANVRLHGNDGNDTFTVNSTAGINNLDLFGDTGDDSFNFFGSSDPTRIDALGSIGNDTFLVGRNGAGRLFLDGQDGSDSYNVNFLGEGSRRIDTRDSGTFGTDETSVVGTEGADRIAIRTTRFLYDNEIVIFDENTERVQANSVGGNDRIVVFGSRSPLTEVFAGNGNDSFVMNSGSRSDTINLNGGNGNDTFLIKKTTVDTTTNLFGNAGNDRFNIGSTVAQDDGNLGLIRGDLNITGGTNDVDGEDQLTANDNGVNAAYSYRIEPLTIQPIAGPANLPRANFAGINYNSSIEYVRLDGTAQANTFEVVSSPTTRYFLDGNSPTNSVGDRLNLIFQSNDGRNLNVTNQSQGDGFVTFTNGNEIVQFQSIESQTFGNGTGGLAVGLDFDGTVDEFFSTADIEDLDDFGFDVI